MCPTLTVAIFMYWTFHPAPVQVKDLSFVVVVCWEKGLTDRNIQKFEMSRNCSFWKLKFARPKFSFKKFRLSVSGPLAKLFEKFVWCKLFFRSSSDEIQETRDCYMISCAFFVKTVYSRNSPKPTEAMHVSISKNQVLLNSSKILRLMTFSRQKTGMICHFEHFRCKQIYYWNLDNPKNQ